MIGHAKTKLDHLGDAGERPKFSPKTMMNRSLPEQLEQSPPPGQTQL